MKCGYCNQYYPKHAQICPTCNHWVYNKNTTLFADEDMFGNPTFMLIENQQKQQQRNIAMWNSPEYQKFLLDKKEMKKTHIICMLIVLFCMFNIVCPIPLLLITSALLPEKFFYPIGALIFLMIIMGMIIPFIIDGKKRGKIKKSMLRIQHLNPIRYYASQSVIGYFIPYYYTKGLNVITQYTTCELEKSNIRTVAYDPKYREFVLYTHRPVYIAYYIAEPQMEFRIPDIFDDNQLSVAFGVDVRSIRKY